LVNEEQLEAPKVQETSNAKTKKIIRKESDAKKEDKVVINLGVRKIYFTQNAKSIKDIFG
jgi:hypothetical protein